MRLKGKNIIHILLPPLVVALLFLISAFGVFLPSFQKNLLDKKKEMIRELTSACWSVVSSYEEMERNGELSREAAQHEAAQRIRAIRYGRENKDYFWINDMKPVMVMHPFRPDLEGENLRDFTDPAGNYLFRNFVETVKRDGKGFVSYMWQWKDDPTRIVPKLSYVRGFAPWGWVIGTGIYLDDVDREINALSRSLLIFSLVILSAVLLLSLFIVRQGMSTAEKYRLAEEEVRAHRDNLESLVKQRTAELEDAYASLEGEIRQREKAQEQIQKDHAFLSTVIEALPFPFYVVDAKNYHVLMANSVACENGVGIGGKCYALTHGRTYPCTGEEHVCPLQEVKRTGQPVKTEHDHTAADRHGRSLFVEIHGYPIFDDKGEEVVQMIEFALDITKRKELEEQLRQASLLDPLTGLYNRRGFLTMTEKQLELSKRLDSPAYLLFIDLDDMKSINDTFGHEAGDRALTAAAGILRNTLREADIIARFGGDEFAAFLVNTSEIGGAENIIGRLEEKAASLNSSGQYPFTLSLSCGVIPVDNRQAQSLDELLSRADSLMYEQKKKKNSPRSRR